MHDASEQSPMLAVRRSVLRAGASAPGLWCAQPEPLVRGGRQCDDASEQSYGASEEICAPNGY